MFRSLPMRLVLAVLAGQFAVAAPCAAQSGDRAILSPLPAASRVKTAADAARILRQLYFIDDFNDGAALGDTLNRRFPGNARVRTWYIGNLARSARVAEALPLTTPADSLSHDPWILARRAFALTYDPLIRYTSGAQAVRLAARAHMLVPHDPDIAWVAAITRYNEARGKWDAVAAYIDTIAAEAGNPSELQVVRANAMYNAVSRSPVDTAKREAVFRAYAAVREADPSNFNAIYFAADRLPAGHSDEALALMKRAVALSPRATAVRSIYWSALNGRKDVPAEQRKAEIAEDRAKFIALTDSAPWALASAASSMHSPKADPGIAVLEDRVLATAPHSAWAENILLSRTRQWAESLSAARDPTRTDARPDSVAARLEYRQALEAFIDRPWHANPESVGEAAIQLFLLVRDDSTYPTARLAHVVRAMVDGGLEPNASITHIQAAVTLADRKTDLAYAERLADEGGKLVDEAIMNYPDGVFSSMGEREDALFASDAAGLDARGWVYFNEGRVADAEKQFARSLDMSKKNALTYYHLGRMRAAEGKAEEAELEYAQGMTVRYRGTNPNRAALESVYRANHGSMDGWAPYLAALEEKERTARRARIVDTRAKDPKTAKVFTLTNLEGHTIGPDSLTGRYLVVNFWGTWCGPCVAEMPELQQFYDKYRSDPSVSILTISNDKDLQALKDWMAKRKLTIPTLWDRPESDYTGSAGIKAWPTTWFIDRDGKINFTAVGNSGALVEEWGWRLEAMREKAVTVP
ncbi:MAG: TlpA family protein disulfide reductase [Gemmatimonadales bacterium]